MFKNYFKAAAVTALMFTMVFITACGQPAAPPATPADVPDTAAPAAPGAPGGDLAAVGDDALVGGDAVEVEGMMFNESPWFEGRGFPPVEERLPRNPKLWDLIPPEHMEFQIGRYNYGPLRTIRMEPVWDAIVQLGNNKKLIKSPGRLGVEFRPSVLESYEISDDLTTFTFTLREGMRWSDGHPVTSEDARFAWYYFTLDNRIHPTVNSWFRGGGDPRGNLARFELVDRYTWRLVYDEPTAGLVVWMAFTPYPTYLLPSHALKQYHIDHADEDTLRQHVVGRGFLFPEEWHSFFQYMRPDPHNHGRTSQGLVGGIPHLGPWTHYQDGDTRIFQRNPYYWVIDFEGNQLPYIDYIHSFLVVDHAAATIRLLAGDVDHSYEWLPIEQVPLFMEHAAAGNFIVTTAPWLHRTAACILINQTYDCPRWRSVAQDVRFRQAISRAICREEILEAVYLGFARVSDLQDPTHCMDTAKALLAEMGMAPAADGFLSPDGDPFVMDLFYSTVHTQYPLTAQILNEVLRELGFNVNFRQVDHPLLSSLRMANEAQIGVNWMHGPVQPLFHDWQFNASWRLWNQYWDTAGEVGEPIPPHVRELYEVVHGIRRNHPRYIPAARQRMREIQAEHYLQISPVEDVIQPALFNRDLRNVAEVGFLFASVHASDAWWFDR